jgi:polysaccharide biosynthesis/export protein
MRHGFKASFFVVFLSFHAFSQQPQAGGAGQTPQRPLTPAGAAQAQPLQELPSDSIRPNYVLGPNDQILIRAPGADEINERPFRIDLDGFINLPLVGRMRAGGLTVQQLEAELVQKLREYIVQPQISISVVQFRSEPVFFVGAFQRPGIYPLQGRRTMVEMLASIGGLQANASRRMTVTRRSEYGPIPLSNAVEDQEKRTSTVEISMGSLRENVNPAEDIVLRPFDVVSVERAEMVYVSGEVAKVGGIELGERDSLSVVQAITMAGGFTRDANRSRVRILRPILNTDRRAEIELDVKRIFQGKSNDFPLLPNDVLYVPRTNTRTTLTVMGTMGLAIAGPLVYLAVR